eukprot:TRINITY_DN3667_c0_g1_i1.p1 TRINITY_DN3667_c0_g1~~TRINITY_DN3667_c0_g1_i1.p1  ORF type:complete len:272 (+),score=56.39 TRINITY_DN3667_c0_g1_i1:210-1025(+)
MDSNQKTSLKSYTTVGPARNVSRDDVVKNIRNYRILEKFDDEDEVDNHLKDRPNIDIAELKVTINLEKIEKTYSEKERDYKSQIKYLSKQVEEPKKLTQAQKKQCKKKERAEKEATEKQIKVHQAQLDQLQAALDEKTEQCKKMDIELSQKSKELQTIAQHLLTPKACIHPSELLQNILNSKSENERESWSNLLNIRLLEEKIDHLKFEAHYKKVELSALTCRQVLHVYSQFIYRKHLQEIKKLQKEEMSEEIRDRCLNWPTTDDLDHHNS